MEWGGRWVDGWAVGWTDRGIDGWMDEGENRCICVLCRENGQTSGSPTGHSAIALLDQRVHPSMDGWMDGCVSGGRLVDS